MSEIEVTTQAQLEKALRAQKSGDIIICRGKIGGRCGRSADGALPQPPAPESGDPKSNRVEDEPGREISNPASDSAARQPVTMTDEEPKGGAQ